jgi:hypothetical protein
LTPEIHPQEITEMCTNDDPLEWETPSIHRRSMSDIQHF